MNCQRKDIRELLTLVASEERSWITERKGGRQNFTVLSLCNLLIYEYIIDFKIKCSKTIIMVQLHSNNFLYVFVSPARPGASRIYSFNIPNACRHWCLAPNRHSCIYGRSARWPLVTGDIATVSCAKVMQGTCRWNSTGRPLERLLWWPAVSAGLPCKGRKDTYGIWNVAGGYDRREDKGCLADLSRLRWLKPAV